MLLRLRVVSSKCFPIYSVFSRQAWAVAGQRRPVALAYEDFDSESGDAVACPRWAQPQGSLATVLRDGLPAPALHVLWGPFWESFLGFGLGWALTGETITAASGTSLGQMFLGGGSQ